MWCCGFRRIVGTTAAAVLAGLIARELGGDTRAQWLTALAQATTVWGTLTGHWLTPYSLETTQWLLMFWLLTRWIRVRDDRLLLVLGVVVGFAALTKFQVLLLCAVLVIAVAVCGPKALLARPMLWAGALIAGAMATPTLIWQARHDWPQLQMTDVVAGEAVALYGGRPGIALQLIVFAGVLGVALTLYGLWLLLRKPQWRQYRFLAVTFVLLFALFVITQGRPYYLAGLYGPLMAVGANGLPRRRLLVWPLSAASVAWAGVILATSIALTNVTVETQIAGGAAAHYRALPEAQQERTALIGGSYIVAAYLDDYSVPMELPPAYSLNRSYGYFPPPPEDQDSALFVGGDPAALRGYFRSVTRTGDVGDDFGAWLLTGRTTPWDEIWEKERTLTVS